MKKSSGKFDCFKQKKTEKESPTLQERTIINLQMSSTTNKRKISAAPRKSAKQLKNLGENVEQSSDNPTIVPLQQPATLQVRHQTRNKALRGKSATDEQQINRVLANISSLDPALVNSSSSAPIVVSRNSPHEIGTTSRKRKNSEPSVGPSVASVVSGNVSASRGFSDESESPSESANKKRFCKSDLQLCLRSTDIIENEHVSRQVLDEKNLGQPLTARFDGKKFIDNTTGQEYRSISSWVKRRMVDLGVLKASSNISGWNYAVVHRDGQVTTPRALAKADKLQRAALQRPHNNSGSASNGNSFGSSSSASSGASIGASITARVSNIGSEMPSFLLSSEQTLPAKQIFKTSLTKTDIKTQLEQARAQVVALERQLI